MTAKELLVLNGDFRQSPLLDTIRRLHQLFSRYNIAYAIIGGMAVIRNGAGRTTHDVDILTTRAGWEKIRQVPAPGFLWAADAAEDKENKVAIDVLFAGDDWDLVFLLPEPQAIAEYDAELGACFAGLHSIIELKLAVYQQKEKEDGPELAAKDLADIVELVKSNLPVINDDFIAQLHPGLQADCRRIVKKVRTLRRKRPK